MRDFLVHFFLPHHTNNHRARALHYDVMLVYVIAFLAFQLFLRTLSQVAPDILGYATNIYVDQLLTLTNTKRREAGLEPLVLNPQLSQAAALKAQDMFANNYWAHNSPQGKTPWDFIKAAGYRYAVAGENLAKNFSDSHGVVEAWMASPTHKDNIVKTSYREIGFAVVNGTLNGEETTLVVQMFGSANLNPVVRPVAAAALASPTPLPRPLATVTPTPSPQLTTEAVNQVPPEVTAAAKPLAIGSGQTEKPGKPPFGIPLFYGVSRLPFMDLLSLNRFVAYGFAGFLVLLFMVDIYLINRRKIVRAAGNSLTHILFVAAMILSFALVSRGAII